MYSTKLTSVWNQQTILFDERRIRRVWRAPNRLKVCWLLFFFQIQCSADDRSQQPTRIDNNWCALLWYTPSFWFLYEFCFLLKFKKFYFLFYTINKKTQLPPFWFHQGDVLCYDSPTCMCTYTQVVWIVPNHFEIHFFTFQIIFFFQIFLSSSFHRRFDVDLFLPWSLPIFSSFYCFLRAVSHVMKDMLDCVVQFLRDSSCW